MQLARLVVLLVLCGKFQTNSEWPIPTRRYTWPNMAFYAYLPDLAPHMQGMLTLTYDLDLDLLPEYIGPHPKIWPQIWTLHGT